MTATRLSVIALISGGKDSLFSILHCQANGHEVVALANLEGSLSDSDEEEIDSYMYQTVGGTIVPLYAEALGLPLYREAIQGSAINTDNTYATRLDQRNSGQDHQIQQDEVESMTRLLQRVKTCHPEISAVCTGAVLSTYQRTRVESVATRLDLIPLSYLWQYPYLPPYRKTSLLEDMSAVGQSARIVKVATTGLDQRHLWLNVADHSSMNSLLRCMANFTTDAGDVLGEGGEYETMAVDGPWPTWKRRIEVNEEDRHTTASGETFTLKCSNPKLVDKVASSGGVAQVRVPSLLDNDFERVLHAVETQIDTAEPSALQLVLSDEDCPLPTSADISTELGNHLMCLARMAPKKGPVVSIMILLRDMASFPTINMKYNEFFNRPNPPARVTIACGDALPDGVNVKVFSCHAKCLPSEIKALHVQSRSYWAPANIAPYSQAMSTPIRASNARVVYVAGQIPLVPASMELFSPDDVPEWHVFLTQAILSLQHLWRVGRAMSVCWWASSVAFITASSSLQAQRRAKVAAKVWKECHIPTGSDRDPLQTEDEPVEDIGDGALLNPWTTKTEAAMDLETLPDTRSALPNPFSAGGLSTIPPCIVVLVSALPKLASIEWYSTGIASTNDDKIISFKTQTLTETLDLQYTEIIGTKERFFCAAVSDTKSLTELLYRLSPIQPSEYPSEIEVFLPNKSNNEITNDLIDDVRYSVIPCGSVFNMEGNEVFAGVRCRNIAVSL